MCKPGCCRSSVIGNLRISLGFVGTWNSGINDGVKACMHQCGTYCMVMHNVIIYAHAAIDRVGYLNVE